MIADVESILKICGLGKYLYIGCGQNKLVYDLLKRSVDAYGMDASADVIAQNLLAAPGRFFQGSLTNYPFNPETFDTIIIGSELLNFKTEYLLEALNILRALTKCNLVLYFAPEAMNGFIDRPLEANRIFWEKAAIYAGFRRHPRSMLVTQYFELENESIGKLTFFERVPDVSHAQYSLDWLLENRDLHMDMLREAGRRSDGHIVRYALAAQKIRPGDVVLDAACGMGYGSAVMAACSKGAQFIGVDIDPTSTAYAEKTFASTEPRLSYQTSDVTQLSFLPDHSVDIVVSFETIEHVLDYDAFLTEMRRVLKPDGRFIGSVPNLWCDETGNDPNPFHFHVFDWNKLKATIEKHFIVEERWAQTAGGGYKLADRKRALHKVELNSTQPVETEWWIISACSDPRHAKSIPYINPFQRDNKAIPACVDFAKYYDNPWLYRSIIQLGERVSDNNVLTNLCVDIANNSRPGSADQGAALCVLAYKLLESNCVNEMDLSKLISAFNKFEEALDPNNPHAYRWLLSLHFVGGRLLLFFGNRAEALQAFSTCVEMDPLRFSPLLATKTISAHMYAGLILAGDGELEKARNHFHSGVAVADRVLHSNWDNAIGNINNPLTFGLQEIAEVADVASQCVQALHAIEQQGNVPGYFWDQINLRRFGMIEWMNSVQRENEWLRNHIATLEKLARAQQVTAV